MSEPVHPGTFLYPMRPELARVLAGAAESAFMTGDFYVVCRYEPVGSSTTTPYEVQKPVATYEEAQKLVDRLGSAFGIFGPFACPFSAPRKEQAVVDEVVVIPRRGTTIGTPITIPGEAYDALFYSIEAVTKFVAPYYMQEYGPGFVTMVMQEFQAAPLALVAHLPWSEEVAVSPGLEQDGRDAGNCAPRPAKTRFVPVIFEHDADGNLQPRRLHPNPATVG